MIVVNFLVCWYQGEALFMFLRITALIVKEMRKLMIASVEDMGYR